MSQAIIKLSLGNYATLRKKVRETLMLGQARIEREKIRTYWEAGKLIHAHILHHKERAGYAARTLPKLAHDIGVHESLIYRCLQFAENFPILARGQELKWSHYRVLNTLPDPKRRLALAHEAGKKGWNAEELRDRIFKIKTLELGHPSAVHRPLNPPLIGSFWTYQIKDSESIHAKRPGVLWLDLGFQTFLEAERFEARKIKAGDIVTSVKDKDGTYSLTNVGAQFIAPKDKGVMNHAPTTAGLYTYKAYLERVIDGDTIKVQIDLGFDTWRRQTIRLQGLDAFELDTKRGKAAKAFVESELKNEPYVTLKTTKGDKYGRYLADVFYGANLYLNQALLDEKLAVRA
jgi:endonuclease YncB( thermonuclease family)